MQKFDTLRVVVDLLFWYTLYSINLGHPFILLYILFIDLFPVNCGAEAEDYTRDGGWWPGWGIMQKF